MPFIQFLGILASQLLDYRTTILGMEMGAAERNGFVAALVASHGAGAYLALKLVISFVFAVCLWDKPRAAWVVAIGFCGVALWNLHVIGNLAG